MLGGGSIQGMINSLRNNRRLLRSKRYFNKERSFLNTKSEHLKTKDGKIDFKVISDQDLLKIKKQIRRNARGEKRKQALILITLSILAISVLVYIMYGIVHQNEIDSLNRENIIQQQKEKEYLRLIEEGDSWLKKSKWHNSRFDYKKAKEIFPNNYEINYRILYSYALECELTFVNCVEAKQLLKDLISDFPERKSELLKLEEKLVL